MDWASSYTRPQPGLTLEQSKWAPAPSKPASRAGNDSSRGGNISYQQEKSSSSTFSTFGNNNSNYGLHHPRNYSLQERERLRQARAQSLEETLRNKELRYAKAQGLRAPQPGLKVYLPESKWAPSNNVSENPHDDMDLIDCFASERDAVTKPQEKENWSNQQSFTERKQKETYSADLVGRQSNPDCYQVQPQATARGSNNGRTNAWGGVWQERNGFADAATSNSRKQNSSGLFRSNNAWGGKWTESDENKWGEVKKENDRSGQFHGGDIW